MKKPFWQKAKYIFWDALAAGLSYTTLYLYRKLEIEPAKFGTVELEFTPAYFTGLAVIPVFWLAVYHFTDFYRDIYRRSRLKELLYTFNAALLGSIFLFFILMLDDNVSTYVDYYRGFLVFFSAHFFLTAGFRIALSSATARRIRRGSLSFPTLMVGSNAKAAELYQELSERKRKTGNHFVGFVSVENNLRFLLEKNLAHLGNHRDLPEIIKAHDIEEVIIATESSEHHRLEEIVNILEETEVAIKMIPDTYDIISGKVRLQSLGAVPLVEIRHQLMPVWQQFLKRLFDWLLSLLALLVLSPVFLGIALITYINDKGPIFFRQKRVGLKGKEFDIIKFRSMVVGAEHSGPQLSSENDERITPWGRIMRKYRLDELPQFYNVLRGDMSIVGPRPERRYYFDQIKERAPHCKYLLKVRPGITSWGMVKYGYAENVDEMIERLKYDVIYIENMSLYNDIKVLIYTVVIVLEGRGK